MNIKVFSKWLIVLAISLPIVSCNQGKGKEKYSSVNETQQSGNSKEIGNTQPNQANEIDQVSDNGERYEIPALREKSGEIILHRRGYTVSYNPKTLIPNWVAWHLSASHTDGPYKRGGIQFHEDDDIPELVLTHMIIFNLATIVDICVLQVITSGIRRPWNSLS